MKTLLQWKGFMPFSLSTHCIILKKLNLNIRNQIKTWMACFADKLFFPLFLCTHDLEKYNWVVPPLICLWHQVTNPVFFQYHSQKNCYWLPRSAQYNLWPRLINATFRAGVHPGLLRALYTRVSHTYKWPFPLGIVVNEDNLKWGWHAAQSQTLLVPNTPAA